MTYLTAWILAIPILYPIFYSDFRNRNSSVTQQKHKKGAFLMAICSPLSLPVYVISCLVIMLYLAWHSGFFDNPFMVFPLHSPWKDV